MKCIKNKIRQWEISKIIAVAMLTIGIVVFSCEISTTVNYDIPEYEPLLVIHGVASPQSGALVLIKYNQPLLNLPGIVPDIPELEVRLLADNEKIQRFYLDSILVNNKMPEYNFQTAYYRIPSDSLQLQRNIAYSLDVIDKENDVLYESSDVYLPPTPILTQVTLDTVSGFGHNRKASFNLGQVEEQISAISVHIFPSDSIMSIYANSAYENRIFGDLTWPDSEHWSQFEVGSTFSSWHRIDQDSIIQMSEVTFRVAYLSSELAFLFKQQRESYPIGEEPFASIYPFYSNFKNNPGIFGLYNEEIGQIELK